MAGKALISLWSRGAETVGPGEAEALAEFDPAAAGVSGEGRPRSRRRRMADVHVVEHLRE